ncbi:hypothetical protein JY651_27700 [Pyxidicoccus parkwayensis]|uniref:Uncharacterized protein n=1 Tax=Pyxidicoccus parkwayensis TaxID=2813578 RepID=A0ABX7NNM9_9BACT|nr:SitI3 family protein [Pyxidicoccus parkwaysis]QSQ19132.1 hypothetical protein JY651_27700 [Pyxidicoccus parkwaysis]
MALEFTLSIGTPCPENEVLAELSTLPGFDVVKHSQLAGPGLTAIIVSPPSDFWRGCIEQHAGFSPSADVYFRLDKFEETSTGELLGNESLITAVSHLLTRRPEDAVLTFQRESIVLLRSQGRLTLNERWPNLGAPERWASVGQPRVVLPLPEL